MVSLNIPEDLYRRIEDRAKESGRSAADQARRFLEQALAEDEAEAALLAEVRSAREARPDLFVTDDELALMKRRGRE